MRTTSRLVLFAITVALAAPASAQSEMGQGEARITSRSDVRLSMESMPGTGSAAVAALGRGVGAQMAQIRRCYEQRIEEDPTVTGTLRLRFMLEARGRPQIEMDRDGVNDATVVRCMTRALEGVATASLTRPTHAVVVLALANSAAHGVQQSQERAREAQQVTLTTDAAGNPTSSGGTGDGMVRFTVTGHGRNSGTTVAAAHRAIMTVLPGLLDCRRHSARRGRTEGGDLTATMQIHSGRTPSARVTRSTVPNDRTRSCVGRVLGHIEQRPTDGNGRVQLLIHFEPADHVEAQD